MRAGGWQHTIGPELAGHTLGLLGLGRLGARMAGIARAFEMTRIAWIQYLTADRAASATGISSPFTADCRRRLAQGLAAP